MTTDAPVRQARVLDPVERACEITFGVLMALSFTGTLSVASAGSQEVRTMMFAAIGCNLAWGITDAVMYLLRSVIERRRKQALLRRLRALRDFGRARQLIADALPEPLALQGESEALETLRQRLVAVPIGGAGPRKNDYVGALGVFLLVAIATFPVVVPFVLIEDASLALRVSNLLALATLFACGWTLGRYVGDAPWKYGLAMAGIGLLLIGVIVALGG